jgi:hypothetical protein
MSKKTTPKKQEPPAEQQPEPTMTRPVPPVEEPVQQQDPDLPMAAPPPSLEDRVAALEKAMIKVDEFCTKHNRYHFGGVTGQ